LILLMNSSQLLFANHDVNRHRAEQGRAPANSIWLWGQGRAPKMPTMAEKYDISGAVVSAVDLIKGIGIYAGLEALNVPGATGYLDTDYRGKAEAALDALESRDFVYIHVEAPDEAGHEGSLEKKIRAIEDFDRLTVGTVVENIGKLGDYRLLVMPDHPTPLAIRTHSSDPVPYVLYGSGGEYSSKNPVPGYNEKAAAATAVIRREGWRLMDELLKK
jgi:2,3-bisphosphoglycerate-independent phosphoglycerate mutase